MDFARGEPVALVEAPTDTLGRVVDVDDDGRTVEVLWEVRPGHEHEVTTEDADMLRRVHESEEGMLAE